MAPDHVRRSNQDDWVIANVLAGIGLVAAGLIFFALALTA